MHKILVMLLVAEAVFLGGVAATIGGDKYFLREVRVTGALLTLFLVALDLLAAWSLA